MTNDRRWTKAKILVYDAKSDWSEFDSIPPQKVMYRGGCGAI